MGSVQDKQNTHQQSKATKQKAVDPQEQAAHKGVAAELSTEALHNLAGWFDVLIQMDLAQKIRNELRSKEDEQENPETTWRNFWAVLQSLPTLGSQRVPA